ncbi:D-sedoheptulose 7-phosphate isomerase [Candidatus Pacearchaeota archaeon]|nr:D-sedoheptulose 7-phosphate isomerase [Candidatus Pacearchaeota archaeon]
MITEGIELNSKLKKNYSGKIEEAVIAIIECLKNNKKILLCGNGGSNVQCSHIAAEFVGRFKKERKALPAIALTTDTAIITAIGNDYGFDKIFERQIKALGEEGDILIAITTSGNSPNIINAIETSRSMKIKTIGLLGKDGGKLKSTSDIEIITQSDNTPRIQEAHITILHIICELVENKLFEK